MARRPRGVPPSGRQIPPAVPSTPHQPGPDETPAETRQAVSARAAEARRRRRLGYPDPAHELKVSAAARITPEGTVELPPAPPLPWLRGEHLNPLDWRHRFLAALAEDRNLAEAARLAGVKESQVYYEQTKDQDFAQAVDATRAALVQGIADTVAHRCRHGWTERTLRREVETRAVRDAQGHPILDPQTGTPITEQVGHLVVAEERERYDLPTALSLLARLDPHRFSQRVADDRALREADTRAQSGPQSSGVVVVASTPSPEDWAAAAAKAAAEAQRPELEPPSPSNQPPRSERT